MNQLEEYNRINNSYQRTCIFHVGVSAGFYSEVDAMMQCMLYCYVNQIRFVLYADDANFSGGHGWTEFFEPFCEENHNPLNHLGNPRSKAPWFRVDQKVFGALLRAREGVEYLTADVFDQCIPRSYSTNTVVDWDLFDVHGTNFQEFAKLRSIALVYNGQTAREIQERIGTLHLPDDYVSIQLRGGDKTLEVKDLPGTQEAIDSIEGSGVSFTDLFVFTDDYRYIEELQRLRPQWHIHTLTGEQERGYYNAAFQKSAWSDKRKNMIKLFAMVEICLRSRVHLGYTDSCVDDYLRSSKGSSGYLPLMQSEKIRPIG